MRSKVLFVTRHDPSGCGGGNYATRAFLNAYSATLNADFIVFVTDKVNDGIFNNSKKLFFIKVPERSISDKIKGLLRLEIHRFGKAFSDYLDVYHQQICYIVLDGSIIGDLTLIANKYKIPVITIHHNVEVKYHIDSKTLETIFGLTNYLIRRNEKFAFQNSILNLTLTESDRVDLIKLYQKNSNRNCRTLGCFEYGIDYCTTANQYTRKTNKLVLAITGTLTDKQTYDGILWFIKKILPELERKYQHTLCITVAGHAPSTDLIKLCRSYKTLKLIANPVNINNCLHNADIYVCPTKLGSGLKLRIMDGLRNGLPILTHHISAKGYEPFYEKPWFKIFSDEISFFSNLDELIHSIKYISFKNDIKTSFKNEYSFQSGLNRLQEILDSEGITIKEYNKSDRV